MVSMTAGENVEGSTHQIFGITNAPFGIKYPLYTSSSIARCGTAKVGKVRFLSHHRPPRLKTYQEAVTKVSDSGEQIDETTHHDRMPPEDLRGERVYVW